MKHDIRDKMCDILIYINMRKYIFKTYYKYIFAIYIQSVETDD